MDTTTSQAQAPLVSGQAPRPVTLMAIAVSTVFAGPLVGASTNAVNGA